MQLNGTIVKLSGTYYRVQDLGDSTVLLTNVSGAIEVSRETAEIARRVFIGETEALNA